MAASTTNAKVTPAADNSELELSATTYSQSGNEYYCKVTWNEVSAVSFTESKVKLYVRGSLFSLSVFTSVFVICSWVIHAVFINLLRTTEKRLFSCHINNQQSMIS